MSFRITVACSVIVTLVAAQTAQAAPYRQSAEHAEYIQGLANRSNGDLNQELRSQILSMTNSCSTAAAFTLLAGTLDTVPMIGSVRFSNQITMKLGEYLLALARLLRISPVVMKALEPLLARVSQQSDRFKNWSSGATTSTVEKWAIRAKDVILHPMTSAVAAASGRQTVYAERVIGALLGAYANEVSGQATVSGTVAVGVETFGPHILGGGLSAFVDYLLFEGVDAVIEKSDLPTERRAQVMPKGKLTREAYRATMLAYTGGFGESSDCKVSLAKITASLAEILARSQMVERAPKATAAAPSGFLGRDNSASLPPAAVTSARVRPAPRPYGGEETGGPDFRPHPDTTRAR